jgi:hypothetical protein
MKHNYYLESILRNLKGNIFLFTCLGLLLCLLLSVNAQAQCPANICSIGNGQTVNVGSNCSFSCNATGFIVSAGGTLRVTGNSTLTINGDVTFANNSTVFIEAGSTLIINGSLFNRNNSNGIFIDGYLFATGDITNGQGGGGNSTAIGGTGSIGAIGAVTGPGFYFGGTVNCPNGPCTTGTMQCGVDNRITSATSGICSGTIPPTITATAITGVSYRWEIRTASASNFSLAPGITNTSQNYSPTTPITETTYYRRVATTTDGCVNTQAMTSYRIASASTLTAGSIEANQTICPNTIPFSLLNVSSATNFTSLQWQSSTNNSTWTDIAGATNATYTPGALSATTYFRRNAIVNNCGGNNTLSSNTVTISITQVATGVATTTTPSVCNNTSASLSLAGQAAGSTIQWQRSNNNGATWFNATTSTGTNATSATLLTAPLANTTDANIITLYRALVTSGTCTAPSNSVTIAVTPSSFAGSISPSNTTVCHGTNSTLLTLSGHRGNVEKWESSTTSNFSSNVTQYTTSSTTFTASNLVATTYYRAFVANGTCQPASTNPITITVRGTVAAPAVTSPVTYCVGASASPLTATGSNLLWYTVALGGTGSAAALVPSTTTAGTTSYWVSQTVDGCESPRAKIDVIIVTAPVASFSLSPSSLCRPSNNSTATSSISFINGGTAGVFTVLSPSGAVSPPTVNMNNLTITITSTTSTGDYIIRNTVTNSCQQTTSSVILRVDAGNGNKPTVNSIDPASSTICSGQSQTLTISSENGAIQWEVSQNGSTGWTAIPGANYPTYDTPLHENTSESPSTLYYRVFLFNACLNNNNTTISSSVSVTTNPAPVAPSVATPVIYCQGATAVQLTSTGSNLKWYNAASGGTLYTTIPTPSTTTTGTTSYWVSQSATLGGCESPRARIDVSVIANPTAPTVTTPVTYCHGAAATPLTATGSNLRWYTTEAGGTAVTTAPTPSTSTVGTVTYWVTQTTNNCESTRARIDVTVNANPAAPGVASPVSYCLNSPSIPLTAEGTNLRWYTSATGGTGSITAPTPSTETTGTTSFWVSQTGNNACESPRARIDVVVNEIPAAPSVISPITYCQGAGTSPLTATGSNLRWYSVASGGPGSTVAPTPSSTNAGITTYYVSQIVNGCESSREAIEVVITNTLRWTGAISTDWNNADNWCGQVPNHTTHVTIYQTSTNRYPILSNDATVRSLIIYSGASMVVNTNVRLTLLENFVNNSTFTTATGSQFVLAGNGEQTIGGAGTLRFANLVINNTSGAILSNSINILESLDLQRGRLNLNNTTLHLDPTVSFTSTYSSESNNFIVAEGSGYVQVPVQLNRTIQLPIGTTSGYSPMEFRLTSANLTGGEYIRVNVESGEGHPQLNYNLTDGSNPIFLKRYWRITPSPTGGLAPGNSFRYSVNFTYDQNDINNLDGKDENLITLGKYSSSEANFTGGTWMAGGATTDPSNNHLAATGLSSFSSFTGAQIEMFTDPISLPIVLKHFTAVPTNKNVELSWATATEINNDYFTIERSADGKQFTELFRQAGAGNSVKELSYSTTDRNPLEGRSYYRLKQTDYDGSFAYSSVQSVFIGSTNNVKLSIFPNPAGNETITLLATGLKGEKAQVIVTDITGRVVFTQDAQLQNQAEEVELNHANRLRSGIYIVTLRTASHTLQQKLIVR